MSRGPIVLLAWGALLALMTVAFVPFTSIAGPFGVHPIECIVLGAAAGACLLAGLALAALDARAGAKERERALTDESTATAVLVAGLAIALLGAGFGLWLLLIGAGVLSLGAGGLAREERARRSARRARAGPGAPDAPGESRALDGPRARHGEPR